MMQHRAEMPKSVGQGVSVGTKQVPASGLVLPAAVWVTGQWEGQLKTCCCQKIRRGLPLVNVTFVCDAGIGCYISFYRTVWKVWSADCQRSGRLFVSSCYLSTEYGNIIQHTFVVCLLCNGVTYSVQYAVCSMQCTVCSVQSAR